MRVVVCCDVDLPYELWEFFLELPVVSIFVVDVLCDGRVLLLLLSLKVDGGQDGIIALM